MNLDDAFEKYKKEFEKAARSRNAVFEYRLRVAGGSEVEYELIVRKENCYVMYSYPNSRWKSFIKWASPDDWKADVIDVIERMIDDVVDSLHASRRRTPPERAERPVATF